MINPDDEQTIDGTHIVMIGRASNEVVADLWRQVLEDEGIVVMLKPLGAGSSFGSSALSEHLIYVREDQSELAREIIADLESDSEEEN